MIQFSCPNCGKAYHIAESQAGKSGKCSKCGVKITVPDASSAVGADPPPQASISEPDPQPQPETSAPDPPVQEVVLSEEKSTRTFSCPGCGERYEVDSSQAGGDIKCSQCGLVFPISAVGATVERRAGPVPPPPSPSGGAFQGGYSAQAPYPPPAPGAGYYPFEPPSVGGRNTVGKVGMWLAIVAAILLVMGFLIPIIAAATTHNLFTFVRAVGIGAIFVLISALVGVAGLICSLVGLSRRNRVKTAATVGVVLSSLVVVAIFIIWLLGTMARHR